MRKKLRSNKKGFTGLEAAIVLTAFIIVAAVFAYVVLNAGYYTSGKAKEVIHTGMEEATSSMELSGDVIAMNGGRRNEVDVDEIQFVVRSTAGRYPVDLSEDMTIVSYVDADDYEPEADWEKEFLGENNGDDVLDHGEKALITVDVPGDLEANEEFTIEMKTPQGPVLKVTRRCPPWGGEILNLH